MYSTHINVLSEYTDCMVDRVHMLKNRPNVQAMFTHFRKHLGSYDYIHTHSCSQQKMTFTFTCSWCSRSLFVVPVLTVYTIALK
jgi:hypothetical protein